MERICDKVVLVTEAGKADGRAVALAFAREGCPLAISDENEGRLAETARLIAEQGGHALSVSASMTRPGDMDRLVERVVDELGDVDILVNTVGNVEDLITENDGTLIAEDWLALFSLNVMSALRATDLVIPAMRRKRSGRIVNIYSDIRDGNTDLMTQSVAFKASLLQLTRRLSRQYKEENIFIGMVSPSSMSVTLVEGMLLDEARRFGETLESQTRRLLTDLRQFLDLGRRMDPEEVAGAVILLAAIRTDALAGASIRIEQGNSVASMP